MVGIIVYVYQQAQKRRKNTVPVTTDPVTPVFGLVGAVAGGGGSIGGTSPYTLSIAAARDPQWWPHTWRISLTESQGSIKTFTIKFKQGSTVISQRDVQNHNSFVTPFLTFVPFNDGIVTTGNYTVEVSTTVGDQTYTSSANITIAADDLPGGFALQTSVARDPQWWPYTQRISLNETTRAIRNYVLTFKTIGGSTISTRTVTGLDTSVVPFMTFVPVNEGITAPGSYQVTVSVVVSDSTYTHTSTFSLTSQDFADGGSTPVSGTADGAVVGWTEPTNPNANVEMIVSPTQITGRFKIAGGSGTYNATAKKGSTVIATANNLSYGTYVEMTINRFYNQEDLSGQTLTWEFEKSSVVSSFSFFTPEVVPREYTIQKNFNGQNVVEFPYFEDRLLQLRITKPFDSGRIKLEDVGENAGMVAFYYKNGSPSRNGNTFNTTVLSPRLVPAMRYVQVIKYLIDPSFGNINDTNNSLFYGAQTYSKLGARLIFWIRTAANQNI